MPNRTRKSPAKDDGNLIWRAVICRPLDAYFLCRRVFSSPRAARWSTASPLGRRLGGAVCYPFGAACDGLTLYFQSEPLPRCIRQPTFAAEPVFRHHRDCWRETRIWRLDRGDIRNAQTLLHDSSIAIRHAFRIDRQIAESSIACSGASRNWGRPIWFG
jgi:hypothetical protein